MLPHFTGWFIGEQRLFQVVLPIRQHFLFNVVLAGWDFNFHCVAQSLLLDVTKVLYKIPPRKVLG